MLQFVCDTCGSVKQAGEPWLLGFAVERLATSAISRDISFAPAWDENKAVQWFAVHFCSADCKDTYVAKLFGEAAPRTVVAETVTTRKSKAPAKQLRAPRRRRA